jgi:hypothetical protein
VPASAVGILGHICAKQLWPVSLESGAGVVT